MNGTCTRIDCAVKHDLPCEMGHADPKHCSHYSTRAREVAVPAADSVLDDDSGQRLPWTGRALGINDMMLASSRSPSDLVGLVGPFNAGKTGFLTAIFTHFAKKGSIDDFLFAGSYTLQGWARLKQYTVWPSAHEPSFPPHTPDTGERVPSLLHLAFRKGTDQIRDVLFTDAPGEWYTRWLRNQSADDAQGARWIAKNATHFIMVVDREGLAGPDVGRIKHNTLALARVLSENRRGRPVIAVWTKSDKTYSDQVEAPIRQKFLEFFGNHPTFDLSVDDPNCLNVLKLILTAATPRAFASPVESGTTDSAFFAFKECNP